ncbi:uncharacterized protein LOC112694982 [Athalia rosae]|uniref:uncharacterized protein LOC112694982 n=1 Tax=Athalia rosae TaxID=37344 RepID=UPI002033EE3A|nr:uncharacterized protein LOC112694982 [Athalia rosae]
MENKLTPRCTSSPAAQTELSPAATKHDSFLDDMELSSHNGNNFTSTKEVERHVTQRFMSPSLVPFMAVMEETSSMEEKVKNTGRRSGNREMESIQQIATIRESRSKASEGKIRTHESKIKTKLAAVKTVETQRQMTSNLSKPQQDRKHLTKERGRRSGSYKEIDYNVDTMKENKQPSNSLKLLNSSLEPSKEHHHRSEDAKKPESREIPESVALLNAIKEIVSTYTKEEGSKILRTLGELHIISQASLIKNMMCQTDEIRKDLQLGENLGQLRLLMAENERLSENFALLKLKNEDLQRKLEETERLREENATLKLKLHELTGRKFS